MPIYILFWVIIGSGNELLRIWHQAIIWTNDDVSSDLEITQN